MDLEENGKSKIPFSDWLSNRLKELKTDESVFCPYITSILEGDEDHEETVEALDGILGELGNGINAESLREEILSKWDISINQSNQNKTLSRIDAEAESDQLREIIKAATEASESCSHKKAETDPKLRAAILSTIAQGSDSDDGEGPTPSSSASTRKTKSSDSDLGAEFGRNTNAEKVLNEQRELKEKARMESAKKKERDKEDRVKQKAAEQDRKDKAKKKATKVERKR